MSTDPQDVVRYANRWLPGESGNLAGSTNGRTPNLIGQLKRKLLAEVDTKKRKTGIDTAPTLIRDQLIERLLRLALKSKDERVALVAIKEIFDRCEGKPNQTVSVTDATTDEFRTKVLLLLQEWRNAGVAPAQDEEALAVRLLSGEGDVIDVSATEVKE